MAKLLIQNGALRYRPGQGLALDDCAECCGNPTCTSCSCCGPADQMASHPSLPSAGVTFQYEYESLATNYSNGQPFSWHRLVGSGIVTSGPGTCSGVSAGATLEYTNSSGAVGTRELVLTLVTRRNANAACHPVTSFDWTRFEANCADGDAGVDFTYFRRPGESWWYITAPFPNPVISGCTGVRAAHLNNDSGGSNWDGSASGSGNIIGNAAVGVTGSFNRTQLVNNGQPLRSVVATATARVIAPELLPCPGAPLFAVQPPDGCSTCGDNNTGGFTV